jgi:hypothetical protein
MVMLSAVGGALLCPYNFVVFPPWLSFHLVAIPAGNLLLPLLLPLPLHFWLSFPQGICFRCCHFDFALNGLSAAIR